MLQTTTPKGSFRRKALLFLLAFLGIITARAELWTPVGEVEWTEGALTGQSSGWNQTWKVAVERSDTRPGVFRLQPYANCPSAISDQLRDNVYVYLHAESPNKVYMEYYIYHSYYYYYSGDKYYHVFQRCPENGFDVQYYGKIVDKNSIEFPANSFAVDFRTSSTKQDAPSSSAKYSTTVHRIVFPDGVLGYVPPQETWVSVGTGHFVDPYFRFSEGVVAETDVTVYKSTTRKDVYKFSPDYMNSDVYLHTEDPDKAYLETYSVKNGNYTFEFTQQCPENGSTLSQYGKLQDGVVEIPSEYFVARVLETSESATLSAGRKCVITLPEGYNRPIEEDHGIYMGLVSFNDELHNKPIALLNETSKEEFTNFVDNMEMGNATLLYYAVDQAITTMAAGTYPENLSNAILITFTDGLDQGSLAMAPEHRTSRNYAAYLSERIGSTNIQDRPLQAYAIGLKSSDVADDELFMINLEALASSADKAHSVSDISEVQEELSRLYEELSRQTSKRTISISVPMMSHDDTYRFTFDHVSDNVENSDLYLEGVFNIDDFSLENVTYHGFTSTSGTKIVAERDGVYLKFTFDDCRALDGDILKVEKEDIDQWTYIASRETWQHNIENDKDGKINIEDIKSSSVIMFALDCSSSLDGLFPTLKETAKSFIDRLAGGNGMNTGLEGNITDNVRNNIPTRYYNLQGMEVTNPHGGLFIEIKDGKSRKVYIR